MTVFLNQTFISLVIFTCVALLYFTTLFKIYKLFFLKPLQGFGAPFIHLTKLHF